MREYDARARLAAMVQATDDPALTDDELDDLMRLARVTDDAGNAPDAYTYWRPNRAYAVGDFVVPVTRNSHLYVVTATDGSSGATEPTWPTASAAEVTLDGVTYREAGATYWAESFDLNLAATEGWRRKAGKAASSYDVSTGGTALQRSQLHKQCLEMVAQYARKVRVRGVGLSRDTATFGPFPGVESNWGFD